MVVIEQLKHRQLVKVRLPKNSEFFAKFGYSKPSDNLYSGDESIPDFSDKIQTNQDIHEQYKDFLNKQDD